MTLIKQIPLDSLEKSDLNERLEDDDEGDEEFDELKGSIEALGDVDNALLVRPTDEGGYEVIKGSRRLRAAEAAKGVDDIKCEVDDIDDSEALVRTITDNIDSFKKDITPRERALSLYRLWEEGEGEGSRPSATGLADLLGVSQPTISTWLEPLSEEWEDTLINPLSDSGQDINGKYPIRELSPRKLRSIRKTTDGGEEGVWLAEKAAEEDLTTKNLADVRSYVNQGVDLENAVGVVTGDLSLAEVQTEIEEPDDTSDDLRDPQPAQTSTAELNQTPTFEDAVPQKVEEDDEADEAEVEVEETVTEEPSVTEDDSDEVDEDNFRSATTMGGTPQYNSRGERLLVTEEEEEAIDDYKGWTDQMEEIETSKKDPEAESATVELEVEGLDLKAMDQAVEDGFGTREYLLEVALRRYLKEGRWYETVQED